MSIARTLSTGLRLSVVVATLAGPSLAFAEETDDEGRKVTYKQKTEIDFEGLDVSGELQKPAGSLVLDRKKASFNPLIKLRTEFNAEMRQSVDEVK